MSFLGGLDLGNPAELALTRDLELRRKDVRTAQRFSGYAYCGGADLVLQHGKFWPGRQLPDQYLQFKGPATRCFVNACRACEANPGLRYCEGYMTAGFGTPIVHGWCIDDGGVVELTLPTLPEELDYYLNQLHLPFVTPSKWAYYGVTFTTALAQAHGEDEAKGFPMLDRGPAELNETSGKPDFDSREIHDFPILKVRYNPDRTELP